MAENPFHIKPIPSQPTENNHSPKFLVDLLLVSREVHLLGGPAGAGKTRWLLDNILLWADGQPFLEFPSHPVPWIYVAGDRSTDSVCRTLATMGIDPKRVPILHAWDEKMGVNEILDKIILSKAGLVVWESFGTLVNEPGRGPQVKAYMQRMSRFCQQTDKTIIGVMEAPKMKPFDRYENPRQRISGPVGWGHHAETIFLVEPVDIENPGNPYRILTVCLRNGAGIQKVLCFDPFGKLLISNEVSVDQVVTKNLVRKSRK